MSRSKDERRDQVAPHELLAACSERDFDGHSAFASLSPRQRLAWLEEAGALLRAMKRHSRGTPPRPSADNGPVRVA